MEGDNAGICLALRQVYGAITGLVDRLEKAGFVRRNKDRSTDGSDDPTAL
jgi:hypothetical protein